MPNYSGYFPVSDQSHLGSYQLVSEPYDPHFGAYGSPISSSSNHGVRRGSPEEQQRPTEKSHQYGWGSPRYGFGSPQYGFGSHLLSYTPAMKQPHPAPPPAPDPYGTFPIFSTPYYAPPTYLQQPNQYPYSPSQQHLYATPPYSPQPPSSYDYYPLSYANSTSLSTWSQQPTPPQPNVNSTTSSWYHQTSRSSLDMSPQNLQHYMAPPTCLQQQYHIASHVFDEMPVKEEAHGSPNCEALVFDEMHVKELESAVSDSGRIEVVQGKKNMLQLHVVERTGNKREMASIGERGKGGSSEQSRMGKLGSMSWCRRCKVECESMEGLVIHSLTSEHQNRTMDLVMSIKQNIQSSLLRPYRAREVFDECEAVYHLTCAEPAVQEVQNQSWYRASCTKDQRLSPNAMSSNVLDSVHGSCVACDRLDDDIPLPEHVVTILRAAKVRNVNIFDANHSVLNAIKGYGLELNVMAPNETLKDMSDDADMVMQWIKKNVQLFPPDAHIRVIVAGNELLGVTDIGVTDIGVKQALPGAMQNLYNTLSRLQLADKFENKFPFYFNVYSFLVYKNDPEQIDVDYALFNSNSGIYNVKIGLHYDNMLDAQIDATYTALEAAGYDGLNVDFGSAPWDPGIKFLVSVGVLMQGISESFKVRVWDPGGSGALPGINNNTKY